MSEIAGESLTAEQQAMVEVWSKHSEAEFLAKSPEGALATMTADPYVLTPSTPRMGGVGRDGVRSYYAESFLPQVPPDFAVIPVSRTVGQGRLVDEVIFRFTHTVEMEWMLPGVQPTGKQVEAPAVVVVQFRDGRISHEHVYWDQASVLVQVGLLDQGSLPVVGREGAHALTEPQSLAEIKR